MAVQASGTPAEAEEGGEHAAPVKASAALRYRDFRAVWVGAFVSNTGNWMQRVTIPYILWELTHSAAWVGFGTFALLIPFVVTGPIGGSFADRFSRRTILIGSNIFSAAVAAALALLWATGVTAPWAYILLTFLTGLTYGFYGPAWHALIPGLVPRELLINAVTLDSTQINAAKALGPALAGLVIAFLGPGAAFLVNALTFVAVLVALFMMTAGREAVAPAEGRSRPFREFGAAIRYTRQRRGIVVSMAIAVVIGLLADPIVQFVVVFTDDVFGVGEIAFGVMAAAFGLGALLAAPWVAGRGSGVARSRMVAVSTVTLGTAVAWFALSPAYWSAVIAILVAGAAWLAAVSSLNTAIQLQVDEAMRGKVMALWLICFGVSKPIGGVLQGWLADQVGPRATVAGAGLVLVAVALVLVAGFRVLRFVDSVPRV